MTERAPIVSGDTATVRLSAGYTAIIDASDACMVGNHTWTSIVYPKTVYAKTNIPDTNGKISTVRMHRMILGAPSGMEVDHINGNGLDNRRSNLRLATKAENGRNRGANDNNTSGYKGVCFHKGMRMWEASIKVDRVRHSLGFYADKHDAHVAYVAGSDKLHKEFARAS